MAKNRIIYVTKDHGRAEGMTEGSGYSIISGDGSKDTLDLLNDAKIPENSTILVFKNNKQIEELAKDRKLNLLNPSAELAEKIENKITQVKWLGDLANILPKHEILLTKNIEWKNEPFILQWAHSHTGDGTFFIQKESELNDIKKKFPDREARVTEYIKGPMFTINIVVGDDIYLGNVSYQITGLAPFTDNQFSTIGNDWALPHTILTENKIEELKDMAKKIGEKLKKENWKGLFGIDVIYGEEFDKIFLIEINGRQPASTTFESQLQSEAREKGVPGITTFEAHLNALTGETITSLIEINDGAQIIQRVTKNIEKVDVKEMEKLGYKVISYKNKKLNSDLARIQSRRGIMETHNKFNERGKEIKETLEK